jgi:hypothetical protein
MPTFDEALQQPLAPETGAPTVRVKGGDLCATDIEKSEQKFSTATTHLMGR